jgi:XTP/dITP diphosphohydrolase
MRLALATANPDKAAEISSILGAVGGVELVARPAALGEVDETGDTLVENARLKARAVCEVAGMAAVADDTGLEVDALDGAPGIYAARYAGPHATYRDNVEKLLAALADSGSASRAARFVTVALVAFPDGTELSARGVVEGAIASGARGAGGFGYDPVFVPEGSSLTFAEMDAGQKDACSHRGRAFRALAELLRAHQER